MSVVKRVRPIGVTLLGYLMLFTAVYQLPTWLKLVEGKFGDGTFLGFLADSPLPQIEFVVRWGILVYCGVGFLRLFPWARLLFLGLILWDLLSLVVGSVISFRTYQREVALQQMTGGQVHPLNTPVWLLTLLVGMGVLLFLFIYVFRKNAVFVPKNKEGSPDPSGGTLEPGEHEATTNG